MKTIIQTITFFSFVAGVTSQGWTSQQISYYWAKYDAPLTTCEAQAQCLKYTITENETPTKCGSPCEYRVCWHQGYIGEGWNRDWGNWGFLAACMRAGHVDHIGDMHTTASITSRGQSGNFVNNFDECVNDENPHGKGYWDSSCTDPETEFTNSYMFANVCQNVPAGHTVHFLMNDGGACSGTSSKSDMTGYGTTAWCAPSTQDLAGVNPGGQTYFPAYSGSSSTGGTCSGMGEGSECVWSVTVPSTCAYEEGDACAGLDTTPNYNDDTVCPNGPSSALVYYENDRNAAPPVSPIHDINMNGDGTVSFKVVNPFGSDLSNLYAVYPDAGANGDSVCPKQSSATDCVSTETYTAQCIDNDSWTFVTIFVTGEDDSSQAAASVNAINGSHGTEVYKCCPRDYEPNGRFGPEHTAAYSYLIHCKCDEGPARALRVSDELAKQLGGHGASLSRQELEAKFLRGELFGDELKTLYNLM